MKYKPKKGSILPGTTGVCMYGHHKAIVSELPKDKSPVSLSTNLLQPPRAAPSPSPMSSPSSSSPQGAFLPEAVNKTSQPLRLRSKWLISKCSRPKPTDI